MREHIADPSERAMAVAMVDVDGLKAANDTYGHQIGDAVLLAVSGCLAQHGAIIGRYGGDEFVAVLPNADRAAGERYREAAIAALADCRLIDPDTGARVPLVMSLGLAIYPEEAQAVDDLIKLSDSAMYAQRRQRAAAAGAGVSRMLGSDRAAKMIGEIVPFLTSPGALHEKLRLVATRLSIGAGYDAVSFTLYGSEPGQPSMSNSYSESDSAFADAWDQDPQGDLDVHPLRSVFERTRRPVIIDDIANSDLIRESQRKLLWDAGLLSGIVAPMIWQGEVVGALSIASKRLVAFGPQDAQFIGAVASQVSSIVRTAALVDELQEASSQLLQAHTETVLMLAGAAEAHDSTTGRHLQRVRGLTEALAVELGHDDETAKEIGLAAVLHDIGKIRVPDYVLTSADSLGDNEWSLMKQHTVWGGSFLAERRGFALASQVARSHHERWDGTGYPDGLAGDEIPEAATITSVADSLDAMTSDRPYRAGRPIDDAVVEVQAWSGRQFSPRVVDALVRLYKRGELGRYLDDHPAHGAQAA
jgi:diguanylate cyclase (GGDEF)-like protein